METKEIIETIETHIEQGRHELFDEITVYTKLGILKLLEEIRDELSCIDSKLMQLTKK